MFSYPSKYHISSGKGSSRYRLVAFDNALIDAGISNYNLIKVSSILPKHCMEVNIVNLEEGSPLLTAFSTISSNRIGERIATAIAVGIPSDDNIGIIMEYEARGETADQVEKVAGAMVAEAMKNHHLRLSAIKTSSIDGIVEDGFLCLVSAIAMW